MPLFPWLCFYMEVTVILYEESNATSLFLPFITRTHTSSNSWYLFLLFYWYITSQHYPVSLVNWQNTSFTPSNSPEGCLRVHIVQALDSIFVLLLKKTLVSGLISVAGRSVFIYNSFCRILLDPRYCNSSYPLLSSHRETKLVLRSIYIPHISDYN